MRKHNGQRCCSWCLRIMPTDNETHEVYCSTGCRDADVLFKQAFSDDEINLHRHYHNLTKGGGNG